MKITRDGIIRNRHRDRILWLWPWRRNEHRGRSHYSFRYKRFYTGMAHYKEFTNANVIKRGLDTYRSYELMGAAAGALYPNSYVLILIGCNMEVISEDLPMISSMVMETMDAICIPVKTEFEACIAFQSFSEGAYKKLYVFDPLIRDVTYAVTGIR